jgi:hypothetical protein
MWGTTFGFEIRITLEMKTNFNFRGDRIIEGGEMVKEKR